MPNKERGRVGPVEKREDNHRRRGCASSRAGLLIPALSRPRIPSFVEQTQTYSLDHITCTLSYLHSPFRFSRIPSFGDVQWRHRNGETCVNVTTMILYLLPGSATTNTGETWPVVIGSAALLLAIVITVSSRPVRTTLAIALSSTTAGCRSRWAGWLFMGGRDDFSGQV